MAVVNTLIGNIKGPKGDTGAAGTPGATGATGADATVSVGSTTTVPYGQAARVTNTGTPGAAVLNFTIPQGRPGEQTTKLDALTLDALTEPSTQFPVPAVGDNGSTLFGKISKWFGDMAALVASKFDAANVVNNLTTTSSGYALDARQGKTLNDEFAKNLHSTSASITYTTTFGTDSGSMVKIGNSVEINSRQYNLNTAKSLTGSTVLFTLPNGYRPNHNILLSCIASKTTTLTEYVPIVISVATNGNVTTMFSGTYYQLWIFGTFTIANY